MGFDDAESHKRLTVKWERHRRILNGVGTPIVAYTVVPEAHSSGRIHWHGILITDRPLRKCTPASRGGYNRWAKAHGHPPARKGECVCTRRASNRTPCFQETARRAGLGINDLQPLRSSRSMSRYITKKISAYVVKGVGSDARWPRYARRVRYSRNFSPLTMRQLRELIRTRYEERLKESGEWIDRSGQTIEVLVADIPTFAYVMRRRRERLLANPIPT